MSGGGTPPPTDYANRYKFNGDFTDATGNNNGSGVASPGFTTGEDGITNHALAVNGTSQYVNCGSAANFTTTSFSLSLWVKATSFANSPVVAYKGMFQVNGWYVQVGTDGSVNCVLNTSGAFTSFNTVGSSHALVTGTWANVAVVVNGTVGKIYINGLDSTMHSDSLVAPASSSDAFLIGCYTTSVSVPFAGAIDDVQPYSRALTSAEPLNITTANAQ